MRTLQKQPFFRSSSRVRNAHLTKAAIFPTFFRRLGGVKRNPTQPFSRLQFWPGPKEKPGFWPEPLAQGSWPKTGHSWAIKKTGPTWGRATE
jgi:hypothetical protein